MAAPSDPTTPTAPIGHSTNLLGIPTELLASLAFNDHPIGLSLAGVREMHPRLFEMLGLAETLPEAGEAFHAYMMAVFGIDPEQRERKIGRREDGARRYRSSYLRLLRGWGYDSNGPEGAVIKGWAESRFGLFPTYHKAPIRRLSGQPWIGYVEEKMSSRFHNNAIQSQLDLVYEFCQWALRRFVLKGRRHLELYRAVNDFAEHQVLDRPSKRQAVVRMNSVVSFSTERETADCFGDTIMTAQVPAVKVLFFSGLLPSHPLKAESEVLVIGGTYRVETSYL
ncbi:NAD(+)--dinitrogen-reductase ADP-D-ribosyltransferase [Roseospirillum parvum]|uniref:NAD+---dinitrogen-reductase ADP-D-ribosyltransferase n=1 Tax=Roseospirillum parvum TaxID=83401 RepID=A0A1G8E0I6_9PROT|nr:NAD(+)--dinitrogen-reductase ADP-D-ribosyltransferase [Roseospirillum parvum]SDH63482.1 NAD+---dinitrogen-reductase ADP-D-ribosyltransferase [Roseospirillum parvum]